MHLRGLLQISHFLSANLGAAMVLVLGVYKAVFRAIPRSRAAILIGFVAAQLLFVIAVGGDYFPFFRFFVPITPVIATMFQDLVIASGAVAGFRNAEGVTRTARSLRFGAVLLVALASGLVATFAPAQASFARIERERAEQRIETGIALKKILPPDATLLLVPVGAIPYFSGLRAHDFYGLTDPVLAKKKIPIGDRLPGHEKTDPIGQISRLKPDVIVVNFCERKVKTFDDLGRRVLSEYALKMIKESQFKIYCLIKRSFLPKIKSPFDTTQALTRLRIKATHQNIPCLAF